MKENYTEVPLKSSHVLIENLNVLLRDEPVETWAEAYISDEYHQDYMLLFVGIMSIIWSITLPFSVTNTVVSIFALNFMDTETQKFLFEKYLPELREHVSHIHVSFKEKKEIMKKFAAMLMKLGWAFLWQEKFIPIFTPLYHPIPLWIGATATPLWNHLSDTLSGFIQTDDAIKNGIHVYPGDHHCRHISPHALWHEESAYGLLDMVFLADYVHKVLGQMN